MITTIIITVWLLFVIYVLVSFGYLSFRGIFYKDLAFQQFADPVDIPYVTLNIQDNFLNMIVDTGCAVSLLHDKALQQMELLLPYRESEKRINLTALTTETVQSSSINIDFVWQTCHSGVLHQDWSRGFWQFQSHVWH